MSDKRLTAPQAVDDSDAIARRMSDLAALLDTNDASYTQEKVAELLDFIAVEQGVVLEVGKNGNLRYRHWVRFPGISDDLAQDILDVLKEVRDGQTAGKAHRLRVLVDRLPGVYLRRWRRLLDSTQATTAAGQPAPPARERHANLSAEVARLLREGNTDSAIIALKLGVKSSSVRSTNAWQNRKLAEIDDNDKRSRRRRKRRPPMSTAAPAIPEEDRHGN